MGPWGNGFSATRGRTNRETRGLEVGRFCLDQVVVAGSKIVKKSNKHIRLYYENFNGIIIPWKARIINTPHHLLVIDFLCGTECNSRLTTGETCTLTETVMSNTSWTTCVSASNTNENFGRKKRGGVLDALGGMLENHATRTVVDSSKPWRWA